MDGWQGLLPGSSPLMFSFLCKKFFNFKSIFKNGIILIVFRQKAREISVSLKENVTGTTRIHSCI
jgi:hypothetical protein